MHAQPLSLLLAICCFAGVGACGPVELVQPGDPPYVPPPESCDAPSLGEPYRFVPCSEGSGVFGSWSLDAMGLPGYDYGLDQNDDPRASFANTEELDRRDHWHAFGNERVNAVFVNDGYVMVATQDRGPTWLDVFDEESGNLAGGWSMLDDGTDVWSTAYRARPPGSKTSRRFGLGYAEAIMEHRGLRHVRRTSAPPGDVPAVVDEIELENLTGAPLEVVHHEVWDVARRPIEIAWLASSIPLSGIGADLRAQRDQRNEMFTEDVTYDASERRLGLRRAFVAGEPPPPPDAPDPIDFYPGDPFLQAVVGDVDDTFTDQAAFFGGGGFARPDAPSDRALGEGVATGPRGASSSGLGQPRVFVMRSTVALAPGETKRLRFVYGYAPMGEPWAVDPQALEPASEPSRDAAEDLSSKLLYFATEQHPSLHRELAWHASQLEVSVGRRDYWGTRVVPQGSAYLYLHGADGAARDLSLFALPLVYTHPSLAKDELRLNMMVTYAGQGDRISYAFQGNGMLDDALGLHEAPSDLGLFLLLGVGEYVGATGDTSLLDEEVPYWPIASSPPGVTGWDHVTGAVRHLFDVVGTGEHGLVRVGTGDWSDGITFEAPDRAVAIELGESVPNTQMAVAILPRVADLLEEREPLLAAEIRARVDDYRAALFASAWGGAYYGRAYFGDGVLAYADVPNLEAQVWALIGGTFADDLARDSTLEAVAAALDDPNPTGATLVPSGQVWPAISGLLTEGYAATDPARAFAHLARNTMASRAKAFPELWYGIWSGPDGLSGVGGAEPGLTWFSPVTPMRDFPVMNNNQHAMPLYAALRLAGLRATGRGLRVAPRMPVDFSLRSQLVDLTLAGLATGGTGGTLSGVWRPAPGVLRELRLAPPLGRALVAASIAGASATVGADGEARADVVATSAGVAFEVLFD